MEPITVEDIAPYLKQDQERELQEQMLAKEKELVTLSGETLTPKEIFQRYSHRVVEVQALNSKGDAAMVGTGFHWREVEILTNFHVVEQARSIRIKTKGKSEDIGSSSAGIMYSHSSEKQDWIQLFLFFGKPPTASLPSVEISASLPDVGENVTVIGNPDGLTNSLSTGIVAGIRKVDDDYWIQITAPISHGSSGSPVFDSKGRFIGLATMMLIDGQNLNFATPIGQIAKACPKGEHFLDAKFTEEERARNSLPYKSLLKDFVKDKGLEQFGYAAHHPQKPPPTENEIQEYVEKYLKEYTDPEDQAKIYDDVAAAYEKRKDYQKGVSVLKKKIELFGEDSIAWNNIGDMLDDLDKYDEAKQAYRKAIKLYLQDFEKDENFFAANTAHIIADILLVSLRSKDESTKWDDVCWVLDSEEAKHLARTVEYQKKVLSVHAELLDEPFFAKDYYESLRKKWLSQNEREIFDLLRLLGLRQNTEEEMKAKGIETYTQVWWEQNVLSKLDETSRLKLQSALQERKSLLER